VFLEANGYEGASPVTYYAQEVTERVYECMRANDSNWDDTVEGVLSAAFST
jgi:hypothetical protein